MWNQIYSLLKWAKPILYSLLQKKPSKLNVKKCTQKNMAEMNPKRLNYRLLTWIGTYRVKRCLWVPNPPLFNLYYLYAYFLFPFYRFCYIFWIWNTKQFRRQKWAECSIVRRKIWIWSWGLNHLQYKGCAKIVYFLYRF